MGFPGGSEVKVSACIAGDPGSIPGSGRTPGEGNGNPLQYSCLENPMVGGAWWVTVHWGHKESDTTERLHFHLYDSMFTWTAKRTQPVCTYFQRKILGKNNKKIRKKLGKILGRNVIQY